MPIIVGTMVVWIAVVIFCLVPKRLTAFETTFLFFIDTVCELGTFSILHENIKLIEISPGIEKAIADLMYRLIELPILLISTTNLLFHSNKLVKWGGVAAIILFSLMVQGFLVWRGILVFHNWNLLYSAIYLLVFVAFSRIMAWVIMKTSTKENCKHGPL